MGGKLGYLFVVCTVELVCAVALIAQVVTPPEDVLGGAAGWVGTGLLGAVLGWLLFVHLPNKDKQIKETAEAHAKQLAAKDEQISMLLERKWQAVEKITACGEANLKTMSEHSQAQMREMAVNFRYEIDRLFALIERQEQEETET